MTLNRSILLIFLSLFLTSCSSGGKKEREAFREFVISKQYDQALAYLAESKFYKDKDSALLKYLEKGMILHLKGHYFESNKNFNKAKEIHQKLYTKSISKKAATVVVNDNYDIYYGAVYERSLLHFYSSLNHFLLYQQGEYQKAIMKDGIKSWVTQKLSPSEIKQHQNSSRAELLAWDSYFDSIKDKRLGKSVFKIDLMAKTYGAFIHESMGTVADTRTALLLYKDAKKYLFRNYNTYSTLNIKSVLFKQNFDDLPKMKKKDIENKYIAATQFQKDLTNFIDFKILLLTKKLDPRKYMSELKLINPSNEVLEKLKKHDFKQSNVAIVFHHNLIPQKYGQKQYFGLKSVLNDPEASGAAKAVAAIGTVALTLFAANELGLMPPPHNYSPAGARLGIRTSAVIVNETAIGFELPAIRNIKIDEKLFVEFKNKSTGQTYQEEVVLVNPIGDIAEEAVAEDSASRYARVGVRLATKHILAIVAAYNLYKSQKEKMGDGFAKLLAVGSYIAASKAIAESEKADTRYWSTLPGDLRFSDFYLPEGNYQVVARLTKLESSENAVLKHFNLGDFQINEKSKTLLNFRSY